MIKIDLQKYYIKHYLIMTSQRMKPTAQYLRALAVLSVVLYHFKLLHFYGGFFGVDIFLLLSGYLLAPRLKNIYNKEDKSVWQFYEKRIKRIFPAYLLYLIITIILVKILALTSDLLLLLKEILYSNFYLFNHYLNNSANNYFQLNSNNYLTHLWSLSLEEQFYLLLPLLLLFTSKIKKIKFNHFILIFTLSSLSYQFYLSVIDKNFAYYGTFNRLWELSLGVLTYSYAPSIINQAKKIPHRLAYFLIIFNITILTFLLLTIKSINNFTLILVLLTTSSILILTQEKKITRPQIIYHIANYIAKISYSLYLYHYTILILFTRENYPHFKLLALLSSLALASLSTFIIELPIQKTPSDIRKTLLIYFTSFILLNALIIGIFQNINNANNQPSLNDNYPPFPITSTINLTSLISDSLSNDYTVKNTFPNLNLLSHDRELNTGYGYKGCGPIYIANCNTKKPDHSKKLIIIYGDSHARMLWAPLSKLASNHKTQLLLLGVGGCPATPIDQSLKINQISANPHTLPEDFASKCSNYYLQSLALIKKLHPDLLIYANSFATIDITSELPIALKTLLPYTKKLLYLKEIPQPPKNFDACLQKHLPYTSACSFPLTYYNEPDLKISTRDYESQLTKELDINTLDLTPYLCYNQRCPVVIDGIIPYYDNQHLSNTYGNFIYPLLVNLIVNI